MNPKKLSGKFIVLDGPDGCGKSTHVRMLADRLKNEGADVVTFRDPGDTDIGERIRDILLNPEHVAMDTATEVMLYMAARVQLYKENIAPALNQNKTVILDRWLSSTCAYQGYAGGFGIDKVIKIASDCLEKPLPDLTIILDVDIETASKRLKKNLDRMEQKGRDYHQKVRDGFLKLAEQFEDFVVIDAAGDVQTTHNNILKALTQAQPT